MRTLAILVLMAAGLMATATDTNISNMVLTGVSTNRLPTNIEFRGHAKLLTESGYFLSYFVDNHLFPSVPTNSHGYLSAFPWTRDLRKSPVVSYPYRMMAALTFSNSPAGKQVYLVKKTSPTGIWLVAKGWLYNTNDVIIGAAAIPPSSAQESANIYASRFTNETDHCDASVIDAAFSNILKEIQGIEGQSVPPNKP